MSNFTFSTTPTIRRSRSRFNLSHTHLTSFNVGDLVPILVQEIYPGDSFKIRTDYVCRVTSSFLKPVMDNLFCDIQYYFVPNRLVYDKWVNVMGENTTGAWAPSTYPSVPSLLYRANFATASETVSDYMGIPPGMVAATSGNVPISLLPFRAFALIYNDWFRDENSENPMSVNRGETLSTEVANTNAWSPTNYTGKLPKVNKFHDYFTSSLPAPLKSVNPVTLPLGETAPINTTLNISGFESGNPLKFGSQDLSGATNTYYDILGYRTTPNTYQATVGNSVSAPSVPSMFIDGSNLVADLSDATAATINDLRLAFQTQRLFERDSRSGSRYIESIKSGFGVDAGDYRLQRPEFLGGSRNPLSIQQVAQTSSATSSSPLAELAAYSLSNGSARMNKGFTEHGFLIAVACIRQKHTYQQGVEKFWNRRARLDFYDPVFAHIGEQPVKRSEIYAGTGSDFSTVFGYQEAWTDLRTRQSRVSGQMRSTVANSLDIWHFGDEYANAPVLGQQFLQENPDYVDRTLSISSENSNQFIFDFRFNISAVRPLPPRSTPGLIDHF